MPPLATLDADTRGVSGRPLTPLDVVEDDIMTRCGSPEMHISAQTWSGKDSTP